MATIQRRTSGDGTVSYRVQVRLKGHPPQSATFARLTDARKWAASTESAIREGRHFPTREAKRHTLADAIDRYIRDVIPTKRDGARQVAQLQWWRQRIGHTALADVTPVLLSDHRDRLAATPVRGQPRSAASVNRHLAALSHVFTVTVLEFGWAQHNPVRHVRRRPEPRGRTRFLSDDERERLLAACQASSNPDLYDAVTLALATGGRRQEVLTLRWPHVDVQHGIVQFMDTKNGEPRGVPVRGAALAMLRARSKVRRIDTDWLFPSPHHPQRPVYLRNHWRRALAQAGITDFRWHDLRHTAASYLAMAGCSPIDIAAVLGHRTLSMVQRYAHLSSAHLESVADKLAARLERGGEVVQ